MTAGSDYTQGLSVPLETHGSAWKLYTENGWIFLISFIHKMYYPLDELQNIHMLDLQSAVYT